MLGVCLQLNFRFLFIIVTTIAAVPMTAALAEYHAFASAADAYTDASDNGPEESADPERDPD